MNLHNSLAVVYETQILENGAVVKSLPPKRNLLLDSGLDGIVDRTFLDSFTHCVLGTGTTPTKRDSGAITVSISSGAATASSGFFEAGDVGRLIKLDSGQEAYIDGFTSSTVVSVTGASDDAASEFTIWYVNETGHETEVVRTSLTGSDTGDNESTWTVSAIQHKRTFIFPEETQARTYREIGWSHTATVGGNLLGRDLIPGGGDSISIGQQYKVVVKLQIVPGPLTQQAVASVGTGGFDTSGNAILTSLAGAFEILGNSLANGLSLEPSAPLNVKVANADFTLPAAPSTSTGFTFSNAATGGSSLTWRFERDAYVAGSHELIIRRKMALGEVNGDIHGVGFSNPTGDGVTFAVKFTTPQTKDSDHTLELAFKLSWGRSLTN